MKIKHILKKTDFIDILAKGKREKGARITVYTGKNPGKENEIGLILAKRNIPLAVTRNYIRRRIYTYFRELHEGKQDKKKIIIQVTSRVEKTKRKQAAGEIVGELKLLLKRS
ncbi:MAG: ribonuclease P protein component [Candidatus Omnitrophota bacterium]